VNKRLPPLFLQRVRHELPSLYEHYLQRSDRPPWKGLRTNPQKPLPPSFLTSLKPIPWSPVGFYVEEKLGHHPFHHAGMFYLQEPSAMAVVETMHIQPEDWVLDVAAAPGGKSTHIAGYLSSHGFLWSHDKDRQRATQLMFNLERMGFYHGLVTTGDIDALIGSMPSFHKILLDAPCSGEGMFLKEEKAMDQWSPELVLACARVQKELLENVAPLLLEGGELTYSTCTFSREENELQILDFLKRHHDFELAPRTYPDAFDTTSTQGVGARLLPSELEGEGHYVVTLRKKGTAILPVRKIAQSSIPPTFQQFMKTHRVGIPEGGHYIQLQERLYWAHHTFNLSPRQCLNPGLYVGNIKEYGFIPSHALSHANHLELPRVELSWDDPRVKRYLKGETFSFDQKDGWYVFSVEGQGLGWIKMVKGLAKNHFPKGLRILHD
jgi:16S rRNA C967 or C1407 C5-methylase (RsmB/RsmF family)/NOL1/NOP2/fmu family ribosome biogenesis protein